MQLVLENMKLSILGSSSAGNCYLLTSQTGEILVIECVIRFEKIKQGLAFKLNKVAGELVTHNHGDHSKAAKDVVTAGLKLYTTYGTAAALGIDNHHNFKAIEKG